MLRLELVLGLELWLRLQLQLCLALRGGLARLQLVALGRLRGLKTEEEVLVRLLPQHAVPEDGHDRIGAARRVDQGAAHKQPALVEVQQGHAVCRDRLLRTGGVGRHAHAHAHAGPAALCDAGARQALRSAVLGESVENGVGRRVARLPRRPEQRRR